MALTIDPEAALLRVRGSYCHENAARALAKAGVWNRVLPPLRIEARMDRPGTDGDMPLGEAARRIMRYLVDRRGLDALVTRAVGPGGDTSDVSIRALSQHNERAGGTFADFQVNAEEVGGAM